MLRISLTFLASASLALAGCATLSTDECSTGDWQKIGVQDGNDGRTLDRFSRHASACKLDKTETSRNLYISGRQEGLKVYCTTVRGYREGALGQTYNGVCPAGTSAQFLKGYELGKRIHEIEARSSFVLDEYHSVTQKLLRAENEAERTQLLQKQAQLEAENARLKIEVQTLRNQADTMVASARKKRKP